jgi:hypothetical protein
MNGRLYDANLHRFLQPDNYVQEPFKTQNYNRYGYVLNNPLKYTDPSGESWWSNNWKSVVTIVAAVATAVVIVASMGTATPLVAAMWAGAGAGFVGGTLGAALNGGTLGQSLMAGFTGALMGAATGYAGAYMSAAIGAVGIVPGALSGAATSTTLGALGNIISGNDWDTGLGMTAVFGAVGGGYAGFSAAKASGSGIWFGTTAKPSVSVIAGNINKSTAEAQAAYDKSLRSQAEPTNMSSSSSATQFDELKVDMGNQGKHLLDHNNYMDGKSILDADPHTLLKNVQSGNVRSIQIIDGVKTRIDFGTGIGTFRDINQAGAAFQTTKALMITSKKGVHFVPSRP